LNTFIHDSFRLRSERFSAIYYNNLLTARRQRFDDSYHLTERARTDLTTPTTSQTRAHGIPTTRRSGRAGGARRRASTKVWITTRAREADNTPIYRATSASDTPLRSLVGVDLARFNLTRGVDCRVVHATNYLTKRSGIMTRVAYYTANDELAWI
jgi:hypothetical protein